MCRSVLNHEWVSYPTWMSEDSGFVSHRKNIYEEALHCSEEECHEYDFHLDAIHHTILMLQPINNKIAQMSPKERANFKLKANLGSLWKAIHQRVIKKIYGREARLSVIQAMQDVPVLAFHLVLQQLKQKQAEWKRAQSKWNKVWRKVDARNYAKSLDHQAISFKAANKKALTVKLMVNQIKTAREEHQAKQAALIDPLFARTWPRYQLEFSIDNEGVLQDAIKLTFSFLDRTQGQLNVTECKWIKSFLRTFIPLFFALNLVEFNSSFVVHEIVESDTSDVEVASTADENESPSVVKNWLHLALDIVLHLNPSDSVVTTPAFMAFLLHAKFQDRSSPRTTAFPVVIESSASTSTTGSEPLTRTSSPPDNSSSIDKVLIPQIYL